jgi:sterol carrier protein 2
MAVDLVKAGLAECVMVIGFEKMAPGSLGSHFQDRTNPLDRALDMTKEKFPREDTDAPFAAQMFGNAAEEYMQRNGALASDFVEIARVNHEHSQRNPYAQFRQKYSTQEVANSPMVSAPLTKLQCCPTSDGAAAAIIVSEAFLHARPQISKSQAVKVVGQHLSTDGPVLYSGSAMSLVGYEMVEHTAKRALAEAGYNDIHAVKVAEVHDCFSTNEMLVIDAMGFSAPGRAHEYVRSGCITYGTKHAVFNPSGGLISKGHPLGATGIAQASELVWQLRGYANNRHVSVKTGEVALQQNAGLGGACVVTVLQRADGEENSLLIDTEVAALTQRGYNPAVEARGVTTAEIDSVRSVQRSPWAEASGLRGGNVSRAVI